jgi:hypothetical protein
VLEPDFLERLTAAGIVAPGSLGKTSREARVGSLDD